jgi:hypothetical protein
VSEVPVAARPEAVDAAWLTAALRAAGALPEGHVESFSTESVGAGMLGDSVRFDLTYDRDRSEAPRSVVGKFASADPTSKATGAGVGLYLKEVRFYQEVAPTVAIRTPRPYFAGIDLETQDFTLLLEDMGPARGGDQIAGCTLADAETAMDEAAALHGPRWGDAALLRIPYMAGNPALTGMLVAGFPEYLKAFRERYDDMLEPEHMATCVRFAELIGRYFEPPAQTPLTVQHLDFRLDNILFEPQGGRWPMAMLDWQSVTAGAGVLDVAYFIGAGLPAQVRQANEEALVRRWLEGLKRYGVTDYGFDQAWRDYRHHLLQGVFTAIFASVGTKRTERGDAMFMAMARRHCAHAADLGSLELLAAD